MHPAITTPVPILDVMTVGDSVPGPCPLPFALPRCSSLWAGSSQHWLRQASPGAGGADPGVACVLLDSGQVFLCFPKTHQLWNSVHLRLKATPWCGPKPGDLIHLPWGFQPLVDSCHVQNHSAKIPDGFYALWMIPPKMRTLQPSIPDPCLSHLVLCIKFSHTNSFIFQKPCSNILPSINSKLQRECREISCYVVISSYHWQKLKGASAPDKVIVHCSHTLQRVC